MVGFFNDLGDQMHSHTCCVLTSHGSGLDSRVLVETGLTNGDLERYARDWSDKNILLHRGLPDLRRGKMIFDSDYYSDREFQKTDFYTGFFRTIDVAHSGGFMFRNHDNWVYNLILSRSGKYGAYSKDERKFLQILRPHIETAMALQSSFKALQGAVKSLEDSFEHINAGMIFLDAHGGIVRANESGRLVLEQHRYLRASNQQLANGTLNHPKLDSLIRRMARGVLTQAEQILIFDPETGQRLYVLAFMLPQTGEYQWLDVNAAKYLVFVNASFHLTEHCLAYLKTEYDLTRKELQFIVNMAAGNTMESIATMESVSKETVRSHLKSVFSKTNVHSQAQLTLYLAQLNSTC